ncbi:hypothetical protein KAU15_00430, partial [candidate division WOR-3 bacterium]|nr:hypothetical protein [candidate division WOR-3 bacterium]
IPLILILLLLISSCTTITTESFRSADTLGGPLKFRGGIGVQAGQAVESQTNPDSLKNFSHMNPAAQAFVGIGILENIDFYTSASVSFPLSIDFGIGIKYKFLDKIGLKGAIIPSVKYSFADSIVVKSSLLGNSQDTISYNIKGFELPVVFTYSIIDIFLLTGGVHGGYYTMNYTKNNVSNNYDVFTYGIIVMPEIKWSVIRISPGLDIRSFYSKNTPISNTEGNSLIVKHFYPFISLSLQF